MTKLRIASDGTVRALWTDAIDWQDLGRLAVHRASHVEFCPRKQVWYVQTAQPRSALRCILQTVFRRPFGETLHWASSRAEALAWERWYYEPGGPGWGARQQNDRGGGDECGGCDAACSPPTTH